MREVEHIPEVGRIDEQLLLAGVFFADPTRRRDRAVELMKQGLTEAVLEDMVRWAMAAAKGERPRDKPEEQEAYAAAILAKRLATEASWRAFVKDQRHREALRATATLPEYSATAPAKRRDPAEARERNACMAYGSIRDRLNRRMPLDAARAEVAREMGISVELVTELAELGSRLQETSRR